MAKRTDVALCSLPGRLTGANHFAANSRICCDCAGRRIVCRATCLGGSLRRLTESAEATGGTGLPRGGGSGGGPGASPPPDAPRQTRHRQAT